MQAGRYRQADARAQAGLVKERLNRSRHGQYRELWDEAVSGAKVPARGKSRQAQTDATQEEKNAKRATRLAQEGQYTRSLNSLLSAGMAQHNRANIAEKSQAPHSPASPSIPARDYNTPDGSLPVPDFQGDKELSPA